MEGICPDNKVREAARRCGYNETAATLIRSRQGMRKEAFVNLDGSKRCLFFDAIEMIDHCDFLEVTE